MAKAHIVLQGKGGVGKSTISAFFAEFKMAVCTDTLLFDADPMNPSFAAYSELPVNVVDLMEDDEIAKHKFDDLLDYMFEQKDERPDVEFIIDIGTSSFPAFLKYAEDNDLFEVLRDEGIETILHCPMVGGDAYRDTAQKLSEIIERFPDCNIVAWKNTHFGDVSNLDGIPFEATSLYKNSKKNIIALIDIPKIDHRDIGIKTTNRLLFEDCSLDHFKRMELRRIKSFWQKLMTELDSSKV